MSPSPAFANPAPEFLEGMEEMRKAEAARAAAYVVPDLEISNIKVPGTEVEIPVRIYKPRKAASGLRPLLIWHHGGAFVFGGLDQLEAHVVACEIADRADAVVVSVDYRLCNDEIKLPTPQIDARDVALWCIANSSELGIDLDQITIGGASAGASLSGSLSLILRDLGVPIAGVALIYPVAHYEGLPVSDELRALCVGHRVFPDEFKLLHNPYLLPDTSASPELYPFPGEAADLSNQPRHLVIHAEFDTLRATGEPYAQQLRDAGVEVHEEIEFGTEHGYLNLVPSESEGMDRTLNVMVSFIVGSGSGAA